MTRSRRKKPNSPDAASQSNGSLPDGQSSSATQRNGARTAPAAKSTSAAKSPPHRRGPAPKSASKPKTEPAAKPEPHPRPIQPAKSGSSAKSAIPPRPAEPAKIHHPPKAVPKAARPEAGKAEPAKTEPKSEAARPGTRPIHRMVFATEAGYSLAAIAENDHLTDFWIQEEQLSDHGTSGNIYRGVVSKVVPALSAAFVDIGLEKDGFLSFSDLGPEIRRGGRTVQAESGRRHKIEETLKPGDNVLVQMAKESIGDKGPSLTGKITLPGRFVILMPFAQSIRMSRMLDNEERHRIRDLVEKESDFEGGLIFRTASEGRNIKEIENDLGYLTRTWKRIREDFEDGTDSKLIHREIALFERVLRDNFTADIAEIVIDHPRLKHRIVQFLKIIAPRSKPDELIKFHTGKDRSVWSAYHLTRDIDQLFGNCVRLKCGGYIIIEEMETLTAIDVNTGRNIGGKSQEENIVETNLEAAVEIPRQLRLRQIGGIIVIDFIDMRLKRNQDRVFKAMERELAKDRTPSDIQQFTDLGLIQITRQRVGKSLTRRLTYTCAHCKGSGRLPSINLD